MPKQEDESLDRLFRPLTEHQADPRAEVWGKIEASIEKEKSKKRLIAFWFMGGIAACCLLYTLSSGIAVKNAAHSPGGTENNMHREKVSESSQSGIISAEIDGTDSSGIMRLAPLFRAKVPVAAAGCSGLFALANEKLLSGSTAGLHITIPFGRKVPPGMPASDPEFRIVRLILPEAVHLFHLGTMLWPAAMSDKPAIGSVARDRQRNQPRHWSVMPFFSQELAGYSLADHDGPRVGGHETEKRERNVFSASTGIYFNYQFRPHWMIQSGVNVAWSRSILNPGLSFAAKNDAGNVEYKVSTNTGYGYFPNSGTTAISVGDSAITDKVYSKLAYVSLPLVFSRVFYFRHLSLIAGAGASFNILTTSSIETRISDPAGNVTSKETMHGLKKTNYGLIVKAELHYAITPQWDISAFPTFKSVLSPINMQTPQSVSPYNFGLGIGTNFNF